MPRGGRLETLGGNFFGCRGPEGHEQFEGMNWHPLGFAFQARGVSSSAISNLYPFARWWRIANVDCGYSPF